VSEEVLTRWNSLFSGVLLGTAVGDALGLPAENLSPQRLRKLWSGDWRMRFFFGYGMISDDTEHTLLVAQALLSEPNDPSRFQRILARKLKWWFASLPGGVGFATAKASLRLWVGFPVEKCAVKSSGSGPAMRSAIIGAYFVDDPDKRRSFTLASSRLTHCGWQSELAALAVAETIALAFQTHESFSPADVFETLRLLSTEQEWHAWLSRMESALKAGTTVSEFARDSGLGRGISGYSLHVVPLALYSWMRHPRDFETALSAVLDCGGDTDTVAAIVGALLGASMGSEAIPQNWLNNLADWPRSRPFIRRVAGRLALQKISNVLSGPVPYFWPALILRNLFFIGIVLLHGFRRLFPPY
jgi:ADP-ribosyl-[dinitrogen reductase] hydrolase